MRPPIPNSYWVEPGKLLAGEHPDGGDEKSTRLRLDKLHDAGVRVFIDLTMPDELPDYRPLLPAGARYESYSIADHGVPHVPAVMRDVQLALERGMTAGDTVYVHCRAGIGRTGMAVGCYLREQGESSESALTELNRLWQQNARVARWPFVPETEEQETFIRDWLPLPAEVRAAQDNGGLPQLDQSPLQRYRGCLVALVVGDALACETAGDAAGGLLWSDDAGLALCAAQSLLASGGFNGRDQLQRYRDWALNPGSHGARADAMLRPPIQKVLQRAVWNRSAVLGSHDPTQLDASALARCAAPAMFAAGRLGVATALGADVARVTHQAPVLVDACRLLSAMIAAALGGASRAQVLAVTTQLGGISLRDEILALAADWAAPPIGRRRPQTGALGAFDRAVRCFARSSGFSEGMERALASPTPDRDAVCATYGALAGAHYGEASISREWLARLPALGQVQQLAEQLLRHGSAMASRVE